MKIFKDRLSAGELLVERLKTVQADLVLGIPRGGVVVAKEVSKRLGLPLDIVVTRKIGSPNQKELALGAVDPDGSVIWDQQMINDLRLKIKDQQDEVEKQKEEIMRREAVYRQGKRILDLSHKTIILVDDGIATGATVLSTIRYLKRHGVKKLVLAVPVGSSEVLDRLEAEVNELVVLHSPQEFSSVGQFYHDFQPVTDEDVIKLLS